MKLSDIMSPHFEKSLGKYLNEETLVSLLSIEDINLKDEYTYIINQNNDIVGNIKNEFLIFLIEKFKNIKFFNILDNIEEAVIIIDTTGRIFYTNSRYSQILNIPQRKIIGKYIQNIEQDTELIKVLKTKKAVSKEKTYIKSLKKYVSIRLFPLFNNGSFEGAFSIFKDITEITQLNDEVKRISDVAEGFSNQIKEQQELKNSDFIGDTPEFSNLISKALSVAKTDAVVLIRGENGSGKEILTNFIYKNSLRNNKPFITVNCAAIPENLIESELFGYEDGSFTGAKKGGKLGKFQLAEGGTIFLDEIGDTPLSMQAKLLRVLQEGEIEKIGSSKNIAINVRIIAATNQNLEELIEKKLFRRDLYYRLNVITLDIPPLRNRKHDIILLSNFFLSKFNKKYGKSLIFSSDVYNYFYNYKWPGNIRELKNAIEYAVILCNSSTILLTDIPASIQEKENIQNLTTNNHFIKNYTSLKDAVTQYEHDIFIDALNKCNNNRSKAIELLKLSRRTFYRKLKELGLE